MYELICHYILFEWHLWEGGDALRNDDELYNSYLSGDTSAYDELMIRYGDSLTIYLNGYLHSWQDSEDLMIEAFARIMVKKPYINEGGFKAYLFRTARNLAARFHGIRSRMKTFSIDDMEEDITDSASLEDSFRDKERNRILHICLENIDPEVREALWLVYFEGLSYKDAAAVMKITARRINHLLSRGKEILRTELEKEGITDAH